MDADAVEMGGTLRPDGTLVLDDRPNLPPGRVRVTLQTVPHLPADDPFWQRMQAIWDSQKGRVPRTREEIDAELRQMDDDAEAEIQAVERLHEESSAARGPGSAAGGQGP
jgi:hypothetical protein